MTVVILIIAGGYLWLPLFNIGRWMLLALLLLLVADLVLLYGCGSLTASRQCSDRFSNGDENTVTIAVESQYRVPVGVAVIDEIPAGLTSLQSFPMDGKMVKGQSSSFHYQLRPTRRGVYSFGSIRLFATTLIGLVERRFTTGQPQEVKVYPSFAHLSQYEFLAIHNNLTEQGIKRIRRVGHHTEFEQIKDYVAGDDYRTINWRATARRHQLMVNVYQDERSQQIYNLIDKGRVMQQAFEGMTLLDYAINASLALSYVAMRKEDRAGLLTFADRLDTVLPASRQPGQMQKAMEVLYAQQTDFGETDYSALCVSVNKIITKRSLLILYTNFTTLVALHRQLPYLQQLGQRHRLLVVFFEEDSAETQRQPSLFHGVIAEKFAYEKRLIVSLLRQHGITALLTHPEQLSVNVINKYLEIKQQSL
jgi:uncharacterized protein (DUF58 family)